MLVLDQFDELTFRKHNISKVKACKFVLPRQWMGKQAKFGEAEQDPVIEWALIFELERTDGVRDLLKRIFYRMCISVHGVDTPFIPSVVVRRTANPVDGRIPKIDIGRSHIDFGA